MAVNIPIQTWAPGQNNKFESSKFYIVQNSPSGQHYGYRLPHATSTSALGTSQAVIIFGIYSFGNKDFFNNPNDLKTKGIPESWIIGKPIVYTPKNKFENCICGSALVEKIHSMSEKDYSNIIQRYEFSKDYYHFILSFDGTGHLTIIDKKPNNPNNFWDNLFLRTDITLDYNNFPLINIHKNTNFIFGHDTNDKTISEYNKEGFFFGDSYYKFNSIIKENFFIYNKTLFTTVITPTSADKVLNSYNSIQNENTIQLCRCISTREQGGRTNGCHYSFREKAALVLLNGESTPKQLSEQFSATPFDNLFNTELTNKVGYVIPSGTTNVPSNYITDLNSYEIKFVRGIDNRANKANFIDDQSEYKIQIISNENAFNENTNYKNTLYLGVNYSDAYASSAEEPITQESLSQLPSSDIIENLTALGELIDNIQEKQIWDSNKSDEWNKSNIPPYKLIIKARDGSGFISLKEYFSLDVEHQSKYKFIYQILNDNHEYEDPQGDEVLESFNEFLEKNNEKWINLVNKKILVNLIINENLRKSLNLQSLELVEAFTRGRDFLQESYTEVRPQEKDSSGNRLINFEDNYFLYKYSGREFSLRRAAALIHEKDLLLESDVTLGEVYGRQTYFIEVIKYVENGINKYQDTFLVKNFLDLIGNTKYTDDDYEIIDAKIDLNTCEYYKPDEATYENNWCDCCFGGTTSTRECFYQKNGVCPYRFTSEKHPRRIKTLEQSKSNRFNLIQELSKVFEVYPQFLIEFEENGKIKLDSEGRMKKHIAYMTEKGSVNYAGFRYEKNLTGIDRNIDSQAITTKLYVESIDSDLAKNGVCSIQTAPDNIGKNSYILDFSYYTKKGLLNPEQTQRDVWGIDNEDFAFLPTIGKYNQEFDELTDLITLNSRQLTELEAKVITSVTGVTTALEERKKNSQKLYQYKAAISEKTKDGTITIKYTTSDTYVSYLNKYQEQATILFGLIEDLFFSKERFVYIDRNTKTPVIIDLNKNYDNYTYYPYNFIKENKNQYCKGELWWKLEIENSNATFDNWPQFKEEIIDKNLYPSTGLLGQYTGFYNQIKEYKKEQQRILNKINAISEKFYKMYEPYIKEGTWTDSNYLTDNEYYWAGCNVLHNSSKPQISYNINVIDISPIEEFEEDYTIDIADTTYVEDIDFFDINPRTGLPNREKVIVSEITDSLDTPQENSIKTQNYTTQFEDLFENITATVQSLTYNENTYKRASNFTAQQYVQTDSLQGTLDEGNLTLINANDKNIVMDDSGTEGSGINNKASKYKLTGEGLYFSTDGGETWDIGVGPQGWNLDYAKFGQLDASKVQIVDGKYLYFLWDKNGINAYRNPSLSVNGLKDFARFNKYGLSLIENGHVRLRAGYEFKDNSYGNNTSGDYQSEIPLTDQNVGFYLYNDQGQPIFKTETRSEYNDNTTDYSARLSLKGEMFITNTNLSDSKIATGQTIASGKTLKLSEGYVFDTKNVYRTQDTPLTTSLEYYTIKTVDNVQEAVNTITLENDEIFNGVIYYKDSDTLATDQIYCVGMDGLDLVDYYKRTIRQWAGTIKNISGSAMTITIDQTFYNKLVDGTSITGLDISGSTKDPFTIRINYSKNIEFTTTTVFVLNNKNASANYTFNTTNVAVEERNMIYYVLEGSDYNEVNQKFVIYKQTYDGNTYYYWGKKEEVEIETDTSNIATKDVGIFINNKLSASADGTALVLDDDGGTQTARIATSGNERVFMIGLRGKDNGKTVFRNVISALKNGVLYVGGEIQSELGTSLGNIEFNTLPDKVRITDASMIVSNNGYIWLDWSKVYNIKNGQLMTEEGSLWDFFNSIGTALNGMSNKIDGVSSDITLEGYYVIDPATEV